MNKNLKKIHIFVSGRVQKVFYRDSARRAARKLRITGWVRNLNDGRVEIVAEGEEKKLKEFLEWTKKGSIMSKVKKVEDKWGNFSGQFKKFEIIFN